MTSQQIELAAMVGAGMLAAVLITMIILRRTRRAPEPKRFARAMSDRGESSGRIAQRLRISEDVASLMTHRGDKTTAATRQKTSFAAEPAAPRSSAPMQLMAKDSPTPSKPTTWTRTWVAR